MEFFYIFAANYFSMIITFEDTDLQELIFTRKNRKYKKFSQDQIFMDSLIKVYKTISAVSNTSDLSKYSFLNYEKLKRINLSSVRVKNGRKERLIFREINNGIEIIMIELNTNHYGTTK